MISLKTLPPTGCHQAQHAAAYPPDLPELWTEHARFNDGSKHPDRTSNTVGHDSAAFQHPTVSHCWHYSCSSLHTAGVSVQPGEYSDLMHVYSLLWSLMQCVGNVGGCRKHDGEMLQIVCRGWNCTVWINSKITYRTSVDVFTVTWHEEKIHLTAEQKHRPNSCTGSFSRLVVNSDTYRHEKKHSCCRTCSSSHHRKLVCERNKVHRHCLHL